MRDEQLPDWSDAVAAAQAAVVHLQETAPLDLWAITHVQGPDETVVAAAGPWERVPTDGTPDAVPGLVSPWLASLGLPMVAGFAPGVAPRVADVPQYAAVVMRRYQRVGAFIGIALTSGPTEVSGTICGYSATPDPPGLHAALPTLRVLEGLLSTIASLELRADACARQLTVVRALADVDELTGLQNRRGWVAALMHEGERSARSGSGTGVVAIDLDHLKATNDAHGHHAGDALLQRTSTVLQHACRPGDVVARTGGDEFAVLVVDTAGDGLAALCSRIIARLEQAGIAAALAGVVRRRPEELVDAWARADRAMYASRRRSRAEPKVPSAAVVTASAPIEQAGPGGAACPPSG